MNLIPAYGRDYSSKAKVEADFNAGKDFIVADWSSPYDGRPVNKADLKAAGFSKARVRYGKYRRVAVLEVS